MAEDTLNQEQLNQDEQQPAQENSLIDLELQKKIEETLFSNLKVIRLRAGLPVYTSTPSFAGMQGETVLVDDQSSIRKICSYLNGTWRCRDFSTIAGGITFDKSAEFTGDNTFVNAGDIMFVAAYGQNGLTVDGITFDSVAMTLIGSVTCASQGTSGGVVYLFMLKSPTVGTKTLAFTTSGAGTLVAIASSYFGASQDVQPDASDTEAQTTTGDFDVETTAVADGCWAVAAIAYTESGANIGENPTAGSNTVIRRESNLRLLLCDSARAQGVGSVQLSVKSISQVYGGVIATFVPA